MWSVIALLRHTFSPFVVFTCVALSVIPDSHFFGFKQICPLMRQSRLISASAIGVYRCPWSATFASTTTTKSSATFKVRPGSGEYTHTGFSVVLRHASKGCLGSLILYHSILTSPYRKGDTRQSCSRLGKTRKAAGKCRRDCQATYVLHNGSSR